MNKKFFEENVIFAVEIEEEDGHRYWIEIKGKEALDKFLNEEGDEISDIDISTSNPPEFEEYYQMYLDGVLS